MTPLWSDEIEQRIRSEAHSLDEQVRPAEVIYCKRCVISNQRPRIVFDEDGICSACRFMDDYHNKVDWEVREAQLKKLLKRYQGIAHWDVVVPASGGKDSSSVAWKLKHDYGMNVLAVKFGPFLYTDIGHRNWDAFNESGFDTMEFRPSGTEHRKLARLAFEYLGDAFQPFVYGQLAYPMHMAVKFGVPLVFGAENAESMYGGDPSANNKSCWDMADWERVYLKGAGIDKLLSIGLELGVFTEDEVKQIAPFYRFPKFDGIPFPPQYHWLAYYTKHHPQNNFYLASEKCGFEANPERSESTFSRYASLDDRLDGFHYYMAFRKFGIGRATSDAAHEVRDLDRTREEALALVARYDGEFPGKYYEDFKSYIGIDDEQFERVAKRFTAPHVVVKSAV